MVIPSDSLDKWPSDDDPSHRDFLYIRIVFDNICQFIYALRLQASCLIIIPPFSFGRRVRVQRSNEHNLIWPSAIFSSGRRQGLTQSRWLDLAGRLQSPMLLPLRTGLYASFVGGVRCLAHSNQASNCLVVEITILAPKGRDKSVQGTAPGRRATALQSPNGPSPPFPRAVPWADLWPSFQDGKTHEDKVLRQNYPFDSPTSQDM